MLLDTKSLTKTIDNINERFLYGEIISEEESLEAARWIASRRGKKGAYRGMFAPTQYDFEQGMRVFTGEKLVSASARHIMGEEAARAIWLLAKQDSDIREAYHKATTWMLEVPDFQQYGTFCCGRCTLAFWRHYWIGNFPDKENHISMGIRTMNNYRLGNGKWRRFPFYYAIYTLHDLELKAAEEELKYARPAMERYIKKTTGGSYEQRRVNIIRKALEKIN